jgi:hypothetical protein
MPPAQVRGDKLVCVADLSREPYVLLGCSSGALRVAQLADRAGQPAAQPKAVRKLTVAPYHGGLVAWTHRWVAARGGEPSSGLALRRGDEGAASQGDEGTELICFRLLPSFPAPV